MLSKLLKYEFKATGRIYGGLYLAILAAAALLGVFFRFPALASDFPIVVVTTVYLMLCVAIAVTIRSSPSAIGSPATCWDARVI